MKAIRECAWCVEEFEVTRADKMCCSKSCSQNYSVWRKTKGETRLRRAVEENGNLRKCNICAKWKDKSKNFSKCGIFTMGKCNDCRLEVKKAKSRVESKEELYNDVKLFVMKMKSNHYYCDAVDAWRLIDIYDRVFPTKLNLPYSSNHNMDMQKSVETMFYKVAKWFADERDHLELKGTLR